MHTCGSLYDHVCTTYRPISFDAFNRHLKRLVSDKLVSINDAGRDMKVNYALTEIADRRLRLKIFELKSPLEMQRLDLITPERNIRSFLFHYEVQ
jgi:hypothetical protein